jgi:hypothetical protein
LPDDLHVGIPNKPKAKKNGKNIGGGGGGGQLTVHGGGQLTVHGGSQEGIVQP